MNLWLAKRMRLLHSAADFRSSDFKTCLAARFVGFWHCAAAFSLQVPNSWIDLDQTPSLLYISILGTWTYITKVVRNDNMLEIGVCFPQACPSAGHRFAASRSGVDYSRRIGSFPQKSSWIRLNLKVLYVGSFHWKCTFVCQRTKPNPTLAGSIFCKFL